MGDRGRPALAGPTATITIGQPDGVDDVVGNGDDFATTVLGDPWDMSQHTDVLAFHHVPNATIADGKLSFTTESDRTGVPILFPGANGRVDVGRVGMNYPIDAARYHWLSFRMYHPGGDFKVKWFYGRYGDSDRLWVESGKFEAASGWHTYVLDLDHAAENWNGSIRDWEGQVPELDIIVLAPSGSLVEIDWVRLTADNPANNDLDITWSDLSPAPCTLTFQLDTDTAGCDGPTIHTEASPAASGSFSWQQADDGVFSPANVAPGEYYVCARANGSLAGYSSGRLTVNQSPVFRFTQPSFTSGADYATDAGNAWDMGERADVDHVTNGNYSTDGDVMAITVPASESDVQVHMNTPRDIKPHKYHYLTYRLWFDYPYTTSGVGQNTRVFWGRAPNTEMMSELIYVYPGWQTYTIDLRSLPREFGPAWGEADWDIFRIDPIANHTGERVTAYMDDILLTGDEEADLFTEIRWEMTDPDTTDTTMRLYYDGDQTGMDGTLIAALSLENGQQMGSRSLRANSDALPLSATDTLSETFYVPLALRDYTPPCQGACYTWHTDSMDPGSYYLYACVDDGYNEFCRYSEIPLLISH